MADDRQDAWRSGAAWAWMLIVCVLSVAIDLGSKEWAFARVIPDRPVPVLKSEVMRVKTQIDPRAISQELIPPHEPRVIIPELLHFKLVLNPGAVFGSGPGQRGFFIGFTVLALGFATGMFAKWTSRGDRFAHIAIGMLIGGGIGNLYDRLMHACVRDFIHPLPGWKWPGGLPWLGGDEIWPYVSNIADLFLLIGILMLLVHLWKRDRAMERAIAESKAKGQADAKA